MSYPIRLTMQAEGAAIAALSIYAYAQTGGGWWLFAALILAPDLAMLAYLFGSRAGAIAYNMAHSYIGPIALGALGITVAPYSLPLALIWAAHIGADRAIGYGLKYAAGFKQNHLQRL